MHLEDLEAQGKLEIINPDYKERFWQYYRQSHIEIPPERVDISQPWWESSN